MKKLFCVIIAICFFGLGVSPWVYSIVKSVQFTSACGNYLSLAADANSIDVAERHLGTAMKYIEENNLTSGYTKIFVYYPKNDFGLWYENLKTAHDQLQEMQKTGYNELEQSNMLMKLRETLLHNEGSITHPEGVSMKENYTLVFWLNLFGWLPCWLVSIVSLWIAMDEF